MLGACDYTTRRISIVFEKTPLFALMVLLFVVIGFVDGRQPLFLVDKKRKQRQKDRRNSCTGNHD